MSTELQPGAKAPSFTLPRDGGGNVSLADFAGRGLSLFFYPKADTSGCTKEAIDFSRLKDAFAKAGADILGVSADPVPAQDKFKAKHKLGIALASDETHRMLQAYGVWQEKSMYGRKYMGIVRTTFLIGPNQRIARVAESLRDRTRRGGSCRAEGALEGQTAAPTSRPGSRFWKHLPKPIKCGREFSEN
jgi:peroxiredoxin Q/BCP